MVISEFTKPEIKYLIDNCNFTEAEETFFLLRTKGETLLDISEMMNVSRRTADNYSKKVKRKIIKILSCNNFSPPAT